MNINTVCALFVLMAVFAVRCLNSWKSFMDSGFLSFRQEAMDNWQFVKNVISLARTWINRGNNAPFWEKCCTMWHETLPTIPSVDMFSIQYNTFIIGRGACSSVRLTETLNSPDEIPDSPRWLRRHKRPFHHCSPPRQSLSETAHTHKHTHGETEIGGDSGQLMQQINSSANT